MMQKYSLLELIRDFYGIILIRHAFVILLDDVLCMYLFP